MFERIHGDLFDFRQHVFADGRILRAKGIGVRDPFHGLVDFAGAGVGIFVGTGGVEALQLGVQIAVDEGFDERSMPQAAVDGFAVLPFAESGPIDFKELCDRQICQSKLFSFLFYQSSDFLCEGAGEFDTAAWCRFFHAHLCLLGFGVTTAGGGGRRCTGNKIRTFSSFTSH